MPLIANGLLGTRRCLDSFFLLLRFTLLSICHLMTEAKTASPLESAVPSIARFQQLGGEPSPSEHPLVKSILAGAQRLLAHQTTKKEPITVPQLEQLVSCMAESLASLYNIPSVVISLLAFAALSDLMSLRAKLVRYDFKIENDMLKLFIQSSKTNQYKDGAWIVVDSSGKATCPVAMMNHYLERAGLSCLPLFCKLPKTKCGYKPRSKGLSYSRLRELRSARGF